MLDTDHWWWEVLAIVAAKVVAIFVIGLVGTMFMVWFERKIVSGMQNRIGPNKAGPFGLLQTLADGTKLFFKEDLLPDRADRIVFRFAPFLAFVPAFLLWSVIPLGGDFRDGKGADGSAVEHNRHADVTQLLFQDLRTTRRQIEECRLLADARHHDRLPAFDDLPGDSFTDANANRAGAILESFNRFDLQFAVAQQGDHAADDAVMAHERDQHALQSGFEIERARKSLADLEQC